MIPLNFFNRLFLKKIEYKRRAEPLREAFTLPGYYVQTKYGGVRIGTSRKIAEKLFNGFKITGVDCTYFYAYL